jgi:hypothetical protein
VGGEPADREWRFFEELGRRPGSGAEPELLLAVEQQLDQGDRIHPQAARPEPEVVRQLGMGPGEGRPRADQVPYRFLDVHGDPVYGKIAPQKGSTIQVRHITPGKVLLVLLLAGALWYMKRKPGSGKALFGHPGSDLPAARPAVEKVAKVKKSPEEIYMGLRQQALTKDPQQLFLPDGLKPDEPYGALMEMGMPNNVVTLACFADGDAGIYYKTGGGMKGGIAHENVRKAAKEFISLAHYVLPRMIQTTAHPLPDVEKVRFYVLTPRGTFTTEANRQALGGTQSELSTLFYSGQEVVAQMRQAQAQKAG